LFYWIEKDEDYVLYKICVNGHKEKGRVIQKTKVTKKRTKTHYFTSKWIYDNLTHAKIRAEYSITQADIPS
jgi:hypothetical protein